MAPGVEMYTLCSSLPSPSLSHQDETYIIGITMKDENDFDQWIKLASVSVTPYKSVYILLYDYTVL